MAFQAHLPSSFGIPSPVEIQGYVEEYDPGDAIDPTEEWMPDEPQMDEAIAWDVVSPTGGLAEAYDPDGDFMIDKPHILKTWTEDTAYWGKRFPLTQKDILRSRKPGTLEIDGEALAMGLTNKGIKQLRNRKIMLRWAIILGATTIDSNGVKRTIDYSSYLAGTPSASVAWSTIASADPIYDMQVWAELFDDKSDGGIDCYVNPKTMKWLANNAKVRDLVKQSGEVRRLGNGNVAELLLELAGVRVRRIVAHRGRYRDSSGTLQWLIPDGKMVMKADTPDNQKFGAWRSTPSTYKGGLNPQPGMFTVVDDQLAKKGRWSVIVGEHGLPVMYLPGCIAVCTLYTP